MEEKKLTDEEVIKALDICYTSPCCTNECPYFNKNGRNFCVENKALYKDMKRIVQEHAEQKAEIERLTEKNVELLKTINAINDLNIKLHNGSIDLKKQVNELTEDRNKQRKLYVKEFAEHANHLGEFEKIKQQAVKDTAKEILTELFHVNFETKCTVSNYRKSKEDIEIVAKAILAAINEKNQRNRKA